MTLDILLAGNARHLEIIRNAPEASGEGCTVRIASRSGLIRLKKQRGSLQDLADIERLSDEGP